MSGRVVLVGAGCGDYDLITLRGMETLSNCDTVVYDSLIDKRLLKFAPDTAEKICVGKRCGFHSESQENINGLLVKKALEGKKVVRLKGGDAFVFGRGGEEISALKENEIDFDIIPGITSSVAVPELAGIPVTHRGVSRSFHVITGHTGKNFSDQDFSAYARLDGTLVFLMGLKNIPEIASALIGGGMAPETPTAVISDGASANQRKISGTLENIAQLVAEQKIKAPAVVVIGETAVYDFSPTLRLPLSGVSVTVTGTHNFTLKLSRKLKTLGAQVNTAGFMKICEYDENIEFDNAIDNIENYDWVVLTSVNGADIFFRRMQRRKIDMRRISHIQFAVIGSGTAERLEGHGIFADLIPERFTSADLGEALSKKAASNEKILIARAENGSHELSGILSRKGMRFSDIRTYTVVDSGEEITNAECSYITFASASGVNAFFARGLEIPDGAKAVCIGEITAEALKKHDIRNFLTAQTQNVQGIIDLILEDVENEKIQKAQNFGRNAENGA